MILLNLNRGEGGLHEERAVATWNFGKRPSIYWKRQEKVLLQQIVCPVEY